MQWFRDPGPSQQQEENEGLSRRHTSHPSRCVGENQSDGSARPGHPSRMSFTKQRKASHSVVSVPTQSNWTPQAPFKKKSRRREADGAWCLGALGCGSWKANRYGGHIFQLLDPSRHSWALDLLAQVPILVATDKILGKDALCTWWGNEQLSSVLLAFQEDSWQSGGGDIKHRVPQWHQDKQFSRNPDIVRNNML